MKSQGKEISQDTSVTHTHTPSLSLLREKHSNWPLEVTDHRTTTKGLWELLSPSLKRSPSNKGQQDAVLDTQLEVFLCTQALLSCTTQARVLNPSHISESPALLSDSTDAQDSEGLGVRRDKFRIPASKDRSQEGI